MGKKFTVVEFVGERILCKRRARVEIHWKEGAGTRGRRLTVRSERWNIPFRVELTGSPIGQTLCRSKGVSGSQDEARLSLK